MIKHQDWDLGSRRVNLDSSWSENFNIEQIGIKSGHPLIQIP